FLAPVRSDQLRRLDLELLQALAIEVAVGYDLLHLPIEHTQHLGIFGAERARAGRTVTVRTSVHDSVTLLLQILELCQQSLALRAGVLRITNPRSPLSFGVGGRGSQGGLRLSESTPGLVQRRGIRKPGEARRRGLQRLPDFSELRLHPMPGRELLRLAGKLL